MDMKVIAVLILLHMMMQLSEPLSASSPSCCTEVANHISKKILRRVLRYEKQTADGICVLSAIILYTRHKKLCAKPKIQLIKQLRKRNDKKYSNGNIQREKKKKVKNRRAWKRQ
uniref:C-C motif chemokine 28 n=1 Tax=Geotrypetes seraphini TaxID=260995 RepID=A0A6P8PG22_GEOSA|nr:C-C motif chemokine 28 [Geotrypetes seraphini]